MSLASATNRVSYTGNGNVDTYAYTFRILDDDDLIVTVRDTDDVETTLTKTTHYTVTGVGSGAGGNVALVNGAFSWLDGDGDLKSSYILTIRRAVDLVQNTDIRNQGDFFPETHEDAFDYLTMIDQQQQDELDRTVKNAETVPSSDFNPTLPADLAGTVSAAPITNATGDGFADAADWPTADNINNAQTYADNAETSSDLAADWATKINGAVSGGEYSAKAYAIGGTGITDTASKGAAKEWAIETASTVDGTDYSAKEWAKGTQVRGIASGGSSKDWANYTGGTADNSDHSAKAWAVGGTGVTDTASKGAAKEWAIETSGTVDGTNYSAKEYAHGTQAGTSTGGSAKNWAQKTDAVVDTGLYSAKEWATGTQTRGAASGGSAKDWANYTSGTVDNSEYSAKKYATDAAASAASAATTLASALWRGVVRVSTTPYTVLSANNGYLHVIDSTSGAITVNLPALSGLTLPVNFGFKLDAGSNGVTLDANGTDTIDGAGTYSLAVTEQGVELIATVDGSPDDWETVAFGAAGGNLTVDLFSGDNSDTTFDLSVTPASENNTQVYISGVYQQKNTYSISGTTITFSAAPPTGTNNIEVVTGTTLSIGVPSDATITSAKFATSAISGLTTATAVESDYVAISDTSDSGNIKKALISDVRNSVYRSVITTDSVGAADQTMVLSGASFTSTLPTAVGCTGKEYEYIHGGTSLTQIYTIATTSAQTVGGYASAAFKLYTNGEVLRIKSNGANWIIVGRHTSTEPQAYSATLAGGGTPTSVITEWFRQGRMMHLYGEFTTGTAGAVTASVTLPESLTSYIPASATGPNFAAGIWYGNISTNPANKSGSVIIATASNLVYFSQFRVDAGLNPLSTQLGNGIFLNTVRYSWNAVVPITEFLP